MPNHKSRLKLLSDLVAAADFIDNHPLGHNGEWLTFVGKTRGIAIRKVKRNGRTFYETRCFGKGDENILIETTLDINRIPIYTIKKIQ